MKTLDTLLGASYKKMAQEKYCTNDIDDIAEGPKDSTSDDDVNQRGGSDGSVGTAPHPSGVNANNLQDQYIYRWGNINFMHPHLIKN